ncbi:MAG: hypothetical protein LQ346_005690 [Caloplaca aetnensis]|nr:MAG: hypothetical protein LQ346_005690 [Caloplaca aetnensis]
MGSDQKLRSSLSKASAPAASSNTQSITKSSILQSSFAPSYFQLALFASVVRGLDSQQIRIHDTASGRLRCEHAIAPKATINCLDWGYYGDRPWEDHQRDLKKKRKRTEQVNGVANVDNAQDVVLAFGTSDSDVHFYSPAAAKVIGTLKNAHTQGIRDFKFVDAGRGAEGWSIGGDGKLVHWDLRKGKSTRIISLPDPSARTLCPFGSSVLCASHKVFLIEPEPSNPATSYTASNNAVHSIRASAKMPLQTSQPSSFLTAAENDRFINVFSKQTGSSIGCLVAENDVAKVATVPDPGYSSSGIKTMTQSTDAVLAALTRDGVLELFESPFNFGSSSSSAHTEPENLKARMKQRTRKATATVKIVRPDGGAAIVPLLDATFLGHELIFVWTEGGVDLRFDRILWKKEDAPGILLEGVHEVVRGRGAAAVGAVVMNGVKDMGRAHVDDSQAVVTAGGQPEDTTMVIDEPEVISISSAEEETDYEDEELPEQPSRNTSEDDRLPEPASHEGNFPSGEADAMMEDTDGKSSDAHEGAAEADEPTFGEMIRANAPGPVDVQAAFAAPNAQVLAPTSERTLQLPSGMSLGTVLTQSLRTNDISLLETCLHVRDVAIVRATIERLDSSLASALMQKLAERFHSRPGRAGSLLAWIQWTVVAHGGYLASQPNAMRTLASLHRVITERARSLPLLLSLKGKLDMLEAQMILRATMQARSKAQNAFDDDDEEGVVYVEGQKEDDSENEVQSSDADDVEMGLSGHGMAIDDAMEIGDDAQSGAEDEDNMPPTMPNGGLTDSGDEGSHSSGADFLDEEAESTDQDSEDEGSMDDINHDDVDSVESDASSGVEGVLPAKRPATERLSNGVKNQER